MGLRLDRQVRINCLCAGSSGVVLCFAYVNSEFWILALIGLTPLLWRLSGVVQRQSWTLGLIFASTFVATAYFNSLLISPGEFLIRLLVFNAVSVALATSAHRVLSRLRLRRLGDERFYTPMMRLTIPVIVFGCLAAISTGAESELIGAAGLSCCLVAVGLQLMLIFSRYVKPKASQCRAAQPQDFGSVSIPSFVLRLESFWRAVPVLRGPPAFGT